VPRALLRLARRLPGLALACSCLPTSRRRRPSRHACRRHRQLLLACAVPLPTLKHAQQLLHNLLYSLKHFFSPAFLFPERSSSPDLHCSSCFSSTVASTTPHPRSSARAAPQQPTEAHQPAQFCSPKLDRSDHSAGELELPPPLGLAVVPAIRCPLAPAKPSISTTSSRESFLATPPPLSCPPATQTPMTSLEPPPPGPVRRRYAATAPLCLNTGQPRDRRESLNISPHLPLTVGEPPHQIWSPLIYPLCKTRPRTYL
jgi:hypothetical protein